jgi:uncharacterized protein (TIGR00255 family)
MISSMTGYGRGEASVDGIATAVEIRSVNSRFLEVTARLPRSLSLRENDVKDLIRRRINRGKITFVATVERESSANIPLKINVSAARGYHRLLNELRKAVKSRERVKLEHLLRFSEVIEQESLETSDDHEWEVLQMALQAALTELVRMRRNEGAELKIDFETRIQSLNEMIGRVDLLSKDQVPMERERLRERVSQLIQPPSLDERRLEMEVALIADKLDITEECVRFRSHNKFFLEALEDSEAVGRKLNFLVQEMNREANTIGSKASSSDISHIVVGIKEELEKIREQLQNVE